MNPEAILKIAAKYTAYADSALAVRGNDNIVAFGNEILAADAQERDIQAALDLARAARSFAGFNVDLPPGAVEVVIDAMIENRRRIHEMSLGFFSAAELRKQRDAITDPLKIEEVFEHDQQCDDMAGVPVGERA